MKPIAAIAVAAAFLLSSYTKIGPGKIKHGAGLPINGTWQLQTGTLIDKVKGDTTITDYTKGKSFIKIINNTHFAFLNHDLTKGNGTGAEFSAGGGHYTLNGNQYTEVLEYCNDRQWEGNSFSFTVNLQNDTLIQSGIEKIDSLHINRLNIEKYVRVK